MAVAELFGGHSANDAPTVMAIIMPSPVRQSTIHGLSGNAYQVDHIAMGFVTGTAVRNVTAQGNGMRLRMMLAKVGTTMQSHTGRHNPVSRPIARPPNVECGIWRRISDSLTNVVTAADINAPSIMNGMACSISPAMPVVMRTSGMVRPCVSNARDAAMRKAASGAPTMRKR